MGWVGQGLWLTRFFHHPVQTPLHDWQRDIYTGDAVTISVITTSGVATQTFQLKKD